MAIAHISNGTAATPAQYNVLVDAINLLLANAISNGGTLGASEIAASIDGGTTTVSPGSAGNAAITYNVDFDVAPAVVVTGSGGRPNTMVMISESQPGPNSFQVHCQDVTTGASITNGFVTVNWIAIRKSS